jgi:hypothetical protein
MKIVIVIATLAIVAVTGCVKSAEVKGKTINTHLPGDGVTCCHEGRCYTVIGGSKCFPGDTEINNCDECEGRM